MRGTEIRRGVLTCDVCGTRHGVEIVAKAENALPANVAICKGCRDAIKRREIGIMRRADGTLHVTDGRK